MAFRYAPAVLARACLAAMAAACVLATAGAHAAPTSALRFQRLGSLATDDLSVLSLAQDRQGFAWIGTNTGLYRYDGYRAVHYSFDPRNPNSLPHDRVAEIVEDAHGRIWAGTQGGLARFDPATDSFTRFAPPPGQRASQTRLIIKAIVADGRGGMWLATWGGLQHFNPDTGRFVRYTHDPLDPGSIASNDVNALARDARGGLWMATWPGGLDYLAPGATRFQHFRIDDPARPDNKLNNARALLMDHQQRLWIGTEKGTVRWQAGTPWERRERLEGPDSRVQQLYMDGGGAVWVGTLSQGLLRWDKDAPHPERYQHRASDPHSLPSDDVRALMQDRSGMLWVGTFTDGISLVNRNSQGFRRFIPYDDGTEGMPGNSLQAIDGAPGGRMWLGNTRGVSLFDPASGRVERLYQADPTRPGTLANNIVYSLYQQPGGPLWVGTSAGLHRLDRPGGGFEVIRFDAIEANFINVIAPGRGGFLWLGTGGDVLRYHPASRKWQSFGGARGTQGTRSTIGTSTIVEDRHGRVWMGSEWNGGGLDMLDLATGRFHNFRHVPGQAGSLGDNNVSSLYEDAAGRIWVGTSKGINQVLVDAAGKVSFRSFAGVDSFGLAKVLAIRADKAGKLWISTGTGLSRMDPDSGTVERYTASDGMTGGFALGAAHAAADGTLYFAGTKGMTAVYPDQVRAASLAPAVAITDITVLNRSLKDGVHGPGTRLAGSVTAPQSLTLSPDDSVFSIEFAALHYADPARNRFAYRLAGFDREWVATDAAHRIATYTNLNPGEYVFEVKAANDRGMWNEEPARLPVRILPPFWKTWWFDTLAALLGCALLLTVHRRRVRRLMRQKAQLRELVAERTRELEESNAKLEALTTTDGLTGVANRRGFDLALAQEWRRARRTGEAVALAMLDVDHFKSYNDRYGHQAGDACLREVARVVALHARRPGDVVARYGGEEFVLLATGVASDDVMHIAEAICESLERLALPHEGSPLGVVTISIGVAVMRPVGDGAAERLVEQADKALYCAKQQGRNRACFAQACDSADLFG